MGINSSVESADAFSADSFLLSSNSSPSTRAKNDMKQLVFPLPASHRGLANAVGENNCFLNVTVQALWHLGPFRTELQRLIDGNAGSVREMMRTALYSNSLDSPEAAAEGEGERDGELVTTPRLLEEVDSRSSTGLGLSGATSATSPDAQGFVHVELEPMDAAAVTFVSAAGSSLGMIDALCNLFSQYEMSHLSVLPPNELRQTLQAISGRFDLGEIADANEALDAILSHIHEESGALCPDRSKCLSHAVFGGLMMEQTFCPKCDATSEPSLREAFMHNCSAVELIDAAIKNPSDTFACLIRRCSGVGQKECPSAIDDPPPRYVCKSKANVRVFCLEAPLALALAVGWTSTSESASILHNFYRLVSRSIRLNQLFMPGGAAFDSSDQGPEYLFRGMVCYYGLHYVSIFQEHGTAKARFLLFDDKTVRPIGAWDEVVALAVKSRYQPVCLLYERSSRDHSRGDSADATLSSSSFSQLNTSITTSSDDMDLSPASAPNAEGAGGEGYRSDGEKDGAPPMVHAVAQAKFGKGYKDLGAKESQLLKEAAAPAGPKLDHKLEHRSDKDCDRRAETKHVAAPAPAAVPSPPPQDIFLNYGGLPKVYEVALRKVSITVNREQMEVYGLQPLVMPDGKVLVGELYSHPQTGAQLPAGAAGVSLLDEIMLVDGRSCAPLTADMDVSGFFKASEENVIEETDLECIRDQFRNEGGARLVCATCDKPNNIPSWTELVDAHSRYSVR